jgi:SAM-dependent methyltransferase
MAPWPSMNENSSALEWATARGEKWRSQLPGMEATLVPVNEPLIRALQLDAPSRIAEIGCGGGATAIEVLQRAPKGSVVHGFDIAPTLIEVARERTRHGELPIVFAVADMAKAAPEKPYDRLVSRFGIMFFDDPRAAFGNLVRWLRPDGRFAFAAWGPPAENQWITTVRDLLAGMIELPELDLDAPGPFRYGDSNKLLALLDEAGFSGLDVREWQGPLLVGGGLPPADAASFALSSFSNFNELLAKAGDEALAEARRLLTVRFSRHQQDGVVRMDACVRIFTGCTSSNRSA